MGQFAINLLVVNTIFQFLFGFVCERDSIPFPL